MPTRTSGRAPFAFSLCDDLYTLSAKARPCEVDLHGGFTVDREGSGHIYYGMPGCGLMPISPTWRPPGTPSVGMVFLDASGAPPGPDDRVIKSAIFVRCATVLCEFLQRTGGTGGRRRVAGDLARPVWEARPRGPGGGAGHMGSQG